MPSYDLYVKFRNKGRLNEFCQENEIPAPFLYKNISIKTSFNFPILLKPCVGSGSRGHIRLYSPVDFTENIIELLKKDKYVVQELLPNSVNVTGAFFLCNDGKVLTAYTHQRLRTSPDIGGVSVFSKVYNNPELLAQGEEILNKVKWNGLIMLEFIYDDRDSKYKLIEANPRLWGSIMLSEYCNAFILKNYIRLCLKKDPIISDINFNKHIRWFFPMDLISYLKKKGKIKNFWCFENTCFINWSYARKDRAIFFLFFSIFNLSNLKKLIKRI